MDEGSNKERREKGQLYSTITCEAIVPLFPTAATNANQVIQLQNRFSARRVWNTVKM